MTAPEPRRPRRLRGARRLRLRSGAVVLPQRAEAGPAPPSRAHLPSGRRITSGSSSCWWSAGPPIQSRSGRSTRRWRCRSSSRPMGNIMRGTAHALRSATLRRGRTAPSGSSSRCRRCSPRSRSAWWSVRSPRAGCPWATRRATSSPAGSTPPRSWSAGSRSWGGLEQPLRGPYRGRRARRPAGIARRRDRVARARAALDIREA